jgi:hypothetical protein
MRVKLLFDSHFSFHMGDIWLTSLDRLINGADKINSE